MYSKEEASKLREQFWITFGKYMKPIPSAEGLMINWVNYKTGIKNVFFRMNATQYKASISIEFTHPDQQLRQQYFEQLQAFKVLFEEALNEKWDWQQEITNDYGQSISAVGKILDKINVFDQQNWPELISFLKPRIIALDEFWTHVKPIFEQL